MSLSDRLPTPGERVFFVLAAIGLFLIVEYFILGWFSVIPEKCRLFMGHLGNFLEFLAAIIGAFAFVWHKRFSDSTRHAKAMLELSERIAAVYERTQARNDVDFGPIIESARAAALQSNEQLALTKTYKRTATFTAYLALFLLGTGCFLQILAQG